MTPNRLCANIIFPTRRSAAVAGAYQGIPHYQLRIA